MNRLAIAFCLSTSIVAIVVAGLALLERQSDDSEAPPVAMQDLRDLQSLLHSLRKDVEELKAAQEILMRRSLEMLAHKPRDASAGAAAPDQNPPGAESAEPGSLQEQVAVLTARLASLEDEEHIARLAQSGQRQVVEKDIRGALDRVGDPEAAPEDRLGALKRLRMAVKHHGGMMKSIMDEHELGQRDLYLPMLDLARDVTLDPAFRADVIRQFHGTRVKELRQPMLDVVASHDVPEVRREALTALYWHLDDATVRQTITQASQGDVHEGVRAAAQRVLPKVEHMEQQAARAEGQADDGQAR